MQRTECLQNLPESRVAVDLKLTHHSHTLDCCVLVLNTAIIYESIRYKTNIQHLLRPRRPIYIVCLVVCECRCRAVESVEQLSTLSIEGRQLH